MTRTVRLATESDIPKVLALASSADAHIAHRRKTNVDKGHTFIRSLIANRTGFIGVIDGKDGDLVGMVGLVVNSSWHSDDLELHDFLTFVNPGFRAPAHFTALIAFAKDIADKLKISLWLGHIGDQDQRAKAKARLYQRHLQPIGAFYAYFPSL